MNPNELKLPPEYHAKDGQTSYEIELFYDGKKIHTFLRDYAMPTPENPSLQDRVNKFIAEHRNYLESRDPFAQSIQGIYDNKLMNQLGRGDLQAQTHTGVADNGTSLTYNDLRKIEQQLMVPRSKPGMLKAQYQSLQGNPVVLPKNWSIIEDPGSVFYSIKLYHHDRLMKSFDSSPDTKDDIHKFIREYENDT